MLAYGPGIIVYAYWPIGVYTVYSVPIGQYLKVIHGLFIDLKSPRRASHHYRGL